MASVKIWLPVRKRVNTREVGKPTIKIKQMCFDVAGLCLAAWEEGDEDSKNTCKIFFSENAHQAFQVDMSVDALVKRLSSVGVVFA